MLVVDRKGSCAVIPVSASCACSCHCCGYAVCHCVLCWRIVSRSADECYFERLFFFIFPMAVAVGIHLCFPVGSYVGVVGLDRLDPSSAFRGDASEITT